MTQNDAKMTVSPNLHKNVLKAAYFIEDAVGHVYKLENEIDIYRIIHLLDEAKQLIIDIVNANNIEEDA